MQSKRSYVGELEWALDQIRLANSDRNENRGAQIQAALDYANRVAIARRGHEPLPYRPNIRKAV